MPSKKPSENGSMRPSTQMPKKKPSCEVSVGFSQRDFQAHVLQLCDYVEDLRIEKKLTLTDYSVVRKKAQQVRKMASNRGA